MSNNLNTSLINDFISFSFNNFNQNNLNNNNVLPSNLFEVNKEQNSLLPSIESIFPDIFINEKSNLIQKIKKIYNNYILNTIKYFINSNVCPKYKKIILDRYIALVITNENIIYIKLILSNDINVYNYVFNQISDKHYTSKYNKQIEYFNKLYLYIFYDYIYEKITKNKYDLNNINIIFLLNNINILLQYEMSIIFKKAIFYEYILTFMNDNNKQYILNYLYVKDIELYNLILNKKEYTRYLNRKKDYIKHYNRFNNYSKNYYNKNKDIINKKRRKCL